MNLTTYFLYIHVLTNLLQAYTKAWNSKITPIFSPLYLTILGFVPFMVDASKESFWFPLAAGTIDRLIMSVLGIFFFLSVFTLPKRIRKET